MPPRLITIPISHYCDKARWALEHSGQPYEEEAHLQLFHYLATLRRGAGLYVPVLLHEGGSIRGSAAIARWADERRPDHAPSLYPVRQRAAVLALESSLDDGFGVPGRLFMYQQTLQNPDALVPYLLAGVPRHERWLAPHVMGAAGAFIKRRLGVDEPTAAAARTTCMQVLDDIAERLGDQPYLFGDTFTAADLTFAALAAPLVLPPHYGVPLPTIDELGDTFAAVVREVRAHPAGAYALRLYREHRRS